MTREFLASSITKRFAAALNHTFPFDSQPMFLLADEAILDERPAKRRRIEAVTRNQELAHGRPSSLQRASYCSVCERSTDLSSAFCCPSCSKLCCQRCSAQCDSDVVFPSDLLGGPATPPLLEPDEDMIEDEDDRDSSPSTPLRCRFPTPGSFDAQVLRARLVAAASGAQAAIAAGVHPPAVTGAPTVMATLDQTPLSKMARKRKTPPTSGSRPSPGPVHAHAAFSDAVKPPHATPEDIDMMLLDRVGDIEIERRGSHNHLHQQHQHRGQPQHDDSDSQVRLYLAIPTAGSSAPMVPMARQPLTQLRPGRLTVQFPIEGNRLHQHYSHHSHAAGQYSQQAPSSAMARIGRAYSASSAVNDQDQVQRNVSCSVRLCLQCLVRTADGHNICMGCLEESLVS